MKELIDKYMSIYKSLLFQFILYELKLRHKDGPHGKLQPEKQGNKNIFEFFQAMTIRLEIITLIYTIISEQNLITYDTIVLPQLKLENKERKIEFPTTLENQ